MDTPQPVTATNASLQPSDSVSHAPETSQTAQDYIATQLRLEADAREALPYQFDACTKPLGPLRQSVFACLTCTPPPASPYQQFTPAGVCYSCSISCHGEHNLVELFTKRDFVCDCGTARTSNSGTPCSLRLNAETGRKGGVTGEEARQGNKYNQNFEGKFCGCGEEYDPEKEKGTMFQCLGLGTVEEGGCGEDWWHTECLMGLPRSKAEVEQTMPETAGALETVTEEAEDGAGQPTVNRATTMEQTHEAEAPLPPGFPEEDAFDHLICYKCVKAFPWIKRYAGTAGFLPAVPADGSAAIPTDLAGGDVTAVPSLSTETSLGKKRKAEDDAEGSQDTLKKAKADPEQINEETSASAPPETNSHPAPRHSTLPPAPTGDVTLFLQEDFRDHLCRCAECFPRLAKHRQLLEEEESYEPPISESDAAENDNRSAADRSVNSGSLLDRGEAALSSMDRVKAIEGVMAYNHVRDKVKALLQPFAESGQPVGAEDIKSYFAKLRGDEQAMREAAMGAEGGGVGGDPRREQGGY
ncbi:hypothetical protein LTR36_003616 [Oleoguttula mirabilis]|uniref:UBR-type domain-containing protein n=1 Tax=Oleoguttula mirabilis TaxID=1507867 RepID=A0AAV9JI31_9PEZI|nr:hypothetical protein LTR36_003616 [Oleoguttula mirabilis]